MFNTEIARQLLGEKPDYKTLPGPSGEEAKVFELTGHKQVRLVLCGSWRKSEMTGLRCSLYCKFGLVPDQLILKNGRLILTHKRECTWIPAASGQQSEHRISRYQWKYLEYSDSTGRGRILYAEAGAGTRTFTWTEE